MQEACQATGKKDKLKEVQSDDQPKKRD